MDVITAFVPRHNGTVNAGTERHGFDHPSMSDMKIQRQPKLNR